MILRNQVAGLAGDVVTASLMTGAGDIVAQYFERPSLRKLDEWENDLDNLGKPFDLRRTAAYTAFGGIYSGAFQHFWFSNLSSRISSPSACLALNQGLMIPFAYYPLLLWLVPKMRARTTQERVQLRNAIDIKKMVLKNWAFWVPLQFIQFSFIPQAFQVLYASVVGFFWKIILSLLTAGGVRPSERACKSKNS